LSTISTVQAAILQVLIGRRGRDTRCAGIHDLMRKMKNVVVIEFVVVGEELMTVMVRTHRYDPLN
jgi:hypothetical protein